MHDTEQIKMTQRRTRRLAIAAAAGGAALLVAGCSAATPTYTATSPTTAPSVTAAPTSTTAASAAPVRTAAPSDPASTVTVKLFQFKPSPLTVSPGTKVTWSNTDDAKHEPTSGTEAAPTKVFDVTLDGKGAVGSFTFDKAGTYTYFCNIHTSMKGEIVVT